MNEAVNRDYVPRDMESIGSVLFARQEIIFLVLLSLIPTAISGWLEISLGSY